MLHFQNIFNKIKNSPAPDLPKFYIQWHLTDCCNLHCLHCYQEDAVQRTISEEECQMLLQRLDDYFKGREVQPQINLTGGEPLIYPHLYQLVDQIRERGWQWALLTNGTFLTDDHVRQIQLRKPVFVQVSLEGPEKVNDACRGNGSYQKILAGADRLVAAGVKTLVSFTVTSNNWRTFPEVAEICRRHRIHKLWCDRYVGKDALCISTEDYQSFLQLLHIEREKSTPETKIAACRSLQFLAGGDGYLCAAGRNLLVFLPDGDMLPCRRLPLSLGNVLQADSIKSLLDRSEVWKELNRAVFDTSCIQCKDFRRCRGGARCVTYAQTGNLHVKDINCPK